MLTGAFLVIIGLFAFYGVFINEKAFEWFIAIVGALTVVCICLILVTYGLQRMFT